MVVTPPRRHQTRHRRTAYILARRAISQVSPVRDSERRADRRRLRRQRERRRDAAFYRGLLAFCGVQQQPPGRFRRVPNPPPAVELPVVLSSDASGDEQREQAPERPIVLVDLDSSVETLPDIDPTPQHQLPALPCEPWPQLEHRVLREAYVLLERLQLPPLQPPTPPPELELRPEEPLPVLEIDWGELEAHLVAFDGPPVPQLEQPVVVPVPQFVPVNWAAIAHALFTAAEQQHREQQGNPN